MHPEDNRLRVLVIDDNEGIHSDFRKIFSARPAQRSRRDTLDFFGEVKKPEAEPEVELACASQGEEGLQLAVAAGADGRPFRVAFVDMRMPPGWDGAQTIESIQKQYPGLRCVICTAYSDLDEAELSSRLGEDVRILYKPFHPEQILEIVRGIEREEGSG